jgi:ABC-type transporter Mla subunit MlaD
MQAKKNRQYVYVFISVGTISFVLSIVFALYKSNFFSKRTYYSFFLDSAAGLSSRPIVSFKGVEVGRVSSFKLKEKVKVNFFILNKYNRYLQKEEVLSFKRNPLTGDIIEVEVIPILNPEIVYPKGFTNEFVTLEGVKGDIVETENGVYSQGVDRLVGNVGRLVLDIKSNNLIEKLNLTLENTNKFGAAINKILDNDPRDVEVASDEIVKSLTEVKTLISGLNKTNQKLYSVLVEVEKNKNKIGGILNHGETTLIQGQQLIEGVKSNSFLSPFIDDTKDLKENVFME